MSRPPPDEVSCTEKWISTAAVMPYGSTSFCHSLRMISEDLEPTGNPPPHPTSETEASSALGDLICCSPLVPLWGGGSWELTFPMNLNSWRLNPRYPSSDPLAAFIHQPFERGGSVVVAMRILDSLPCTSRSLHHSPLFSKIFHPGPPRNVAQLSHSTSTGIVVRHW